MARKIVHMAERANRLVIPHSWSSDLLTAASLSNLAMWPWAAQNRRRAARSGLASPAFLGRMYTGMLTRAAIVGVLERVRNGVTELMVHPGHVDAALRAWPTRLVESRAEEVAALCADDTWDAIRARAITLVRHDLREVRVEEDCRAS